MDHVPRWIDGISFACIQLADLFHVFAGQGKIKNLTVFLDSLGIGGFGNQDDAPFQVPAQNDLSHRFMMPLSDLF
ncbi:hypothetical protein D3C81_2135600 [compost metagenome]